MGGVFSKAAIPDLPGGYFDFTASPPDPILQPSIGIVAIPFVHSWGPANQVVILNSWGDFLRYFGSGLAPGSQGPYSPGYVAVANAFKGEGLPGRAGAGQVIAYRMVGSGGAAATKTLSNGTASAITLTAKYEGSYGNNLQVAVVPNAKNPATQTDLVLYLGTTKIETWTYNNTDITGLAAQINDPNFGSKWVSASGVTSGTALTGITTPSAFTAGNDGATLTATDWTNAQSALEVNRFSVFAPFDLTDDSIMASMLTWIQQKNSGGKRFMGVFGGAAGESATTAIARAQSLDDPNVITIGVGTLTDADYGDLSTSQVATRVAGVLAERGETADITFARFNGLSIKVGPTDDDTLAALAGGVITFARDSHPVAPVRLQKAVTTFTLTTDPNRPFGTFSVPKFVRIMQALETDLNEEIENQDMLGSRPVNDATRNDIRTLMQSMLDARVRDVILQPGAVVQIDSNPPPSDLDTFVALLYQIRFVRSMDKVLNTVVVG